MKFRFSTSGSNFLGKQFPSVHKTSVYGVNKIMKKKQVVKEEQKSKGLGMRERNYRKETLERLGIT